MAKKIVNVRDVTPKGGVAELRKIAAEHGRNSQQYKDAVSRIGGQMVDNIRAKLNQGVR